MRKRIQIMMDNECIKILKQAEKMNPMNTNRSRLIEHAVRKVYTNKVEALRKEAKEHQQRIMEIKDKIKELEENK